MRAVDRSLRRSDPDVGSVYSVYMHVSVSDGRFLSHDF
jgi:hypothetical protein